MNREEKLKKCCIIIKMIEFNLKEYEIGKISNLLKEIPVVPTTDLDSYINDIKKIILPKLNYIKNSLEHNKKISKSRSSYGDYIVKNWSNKSSLGLELMKFYKFLI